MTITAIGFTNKFYTLWEITEETRPLGNGHNYIVTHYNYIKNISFDKETALAKYPNAIFDENLHGKTVSWHTEKEVWDNVDTFRFGKYKYDNIENCSDTNYIVWYWDQVDMEHKDYVTKVLLSRGYEIRTNSYISYEGEEKTYQILVSPEEIAEEKAFQIKNEKAINNAKEGKTVELFISSNPEFDGCIVVDGINYWFEEVKENWYQGFEYYLPVLNGKAKRVKNKTILATLSYKNDKIYIVNFSIKK